MKTGPKTSSITRTGATARVNAMLSSPPRSKPNAIKQIARIKRDFVKANIIGSYHGLRKNHCRIYQQKGPRWLVSVYRAETTRFFSATNQLGGCLAL